jgi:hypothetical protein
MLAWCSRMYATGSKFAAVKWPMSRLILKYFDIFVAAAKLSGVANSLGSATFECPCIATIVRCLSANGAIRFATSSVVDAVMISAPSALVISKPRSISASV